ncbi:hypothetical protein SAMN05216368_10241 [Cryobacterium flavum]|uniref:Uncharacterized protein n=1 Tax=Cryobacterium flavum TaxID=1424659 RepID=A0A5E9FV13_9MICO|nr:hypothetical protein SAMN05216368_10241 [Cryobacterium flavum]
MQASATIATAGGLRIAVVRVLDGFGPHHFRGATVTVAT